jgi:tetratricopeptide (TPR) repeat protein
MKIFSRLMLFTFANLTLFVMLACAQTKLIDPSVPPPPPSDHAAAKPEAPPSAPAAKMDPSVPPPPPHEEADEEPTKPDLPAYDPLGAERSINVGQFYLKQGNYDAAIDRFLEATRMHPNYGKPYELLGMAYEKKRDFPNAVKSYQQCLRVYPRDPDRKKLEAHIAELQKKQQDDAKPGAKQDH